MAQQINTFMIPSCTDTNNCNKHLCQGYLVCLHEISQTDYESMVTQFFGNLQPAVSILAADLDPTGLNCDSIIYFHGDETNKTSNILDTTDVWVEITYGFVGNYSITLFKGLIALFQPDYFYFSKAISSRTNKYTLTFYLTRSGSADPVYFGDLSDVYP